MLPPLSCRVASIEWFAEECKRLYGDLLQTVSPTHRPVVMKQPIGVVGAITPWNFPFSMITRKVSPAIAVGCPVSFACTTIKTWVFCEMAIWCLNHSSCCSATGHCGGLACKLCARPNASCVSRAVGLPCN